MMRGSCLASIASTSLQLETASGRDPTTSPPRLLTPTLRRQPLAA